MKPNTFRFSSWLFLRILALVHVIAFVSAWKQIGGLVGPHGILPAGRFLALVHQSIGAAAYWRLPTLCWCFGTGWFLPGMCALGVLLALLLFAGVAPALCLGLLWADYLSLAWAGQIFFNFQWDALLLEATLLAVFLAPWRWRPGWKPSAPSPLARWLLLWLLFRLMFLSGLVKLASGDPTWWHLTALTIHYQTQPLPTPLAWYATQLPVWFHRDSCAVLFAIELLAPVALFGPRRLRHGAAFAIIALQVLIELTGNYTFFNLLTVALCFLCLDDACWQRLPFSRPFLAKPESASPPPRLFLRGFAVLVFTFTTLEAAADFIPLVAEHPVLGSLANVIGPFRSLNNYGLFARMTTTRPELIFEGSDDGHDWQPYAFPCKPGDLARRPSIVAPGQPRLDWQLWFAALGSPEENNWVLALSMQLLEGTPQVLALFSHNPFPRHPPAYLRVVRYEYRFTNRAERAATGNWWERDVLDFYLPACSLEITDRPRLVPLN